MGLYSQTAQEYVTVATASEINPFICYTADILNFLEFIMATITFDTLKWLF
jgi:hypothetical protein